MEPRYTSIQRVRYKTGLLTVDDLPDDTLVVLIEQAEAEIEGWADRDGVNPECWSPTVPPLVVHAVTLKASEIALARKFHDARLASSESRSGTSATLSSEDGIVYLRDEAKKTWQEYLTTAGVSAPSSMRFDIAPMVGTISEKTWRRTRHKKKGS